MDVQIAPGHLKFVAEVEAKEIRDRVRCQRSEREGEWACQRVVAGIARSLSRYSEEERSGRFWWGNARNEKGEEENRTKGL